MDTFHFSLSYLMNGPHWRLEVKGADERIRLVLGYETREETIKAARAEGWTGDESEVPVAKAKEEVL